ncbi:MAG: cytochrome-c peroxidase [Cellvibrionaceae bacterium]
MKVFKPFKQDFIYRYVLPSIVSIPLLSGCGSSSTTAVEDPPDQIVSIEEVGRHLYFDTNLSNPVGQSCASCHTPEVGFDDPNDMEPTSEGAIAGRFGSRNSPTASYAAFIPRLLFDVEEQRYVGGLFWDGRADSLEEQAQGPFLNPLEMNMASKEAVVEAVRQSDYADDFIAVFGDDVFDEGEDEVEEAYINISEAIAAFERTPLFAPFTSKFDAVQAGEAEFTESEARGFDLFVDEVEDGGADCAGCHNSFEDGPILFSNFEYENLGVPANRESRFYTQSSELNPDGENFIDLGLGAVVGDDREDGKFRTTPLRNVAETAPYMHNGVFKDLESVLRFYNDRDPNDAEVTRNLTDDENVGNLNLSDQDIADLEAFLRALSDGYSQ